MSAQAGESTLELATSAVDALLGYTRQLEPYVAAGRAPNSEEEGRLLSQAASLAVSLHSKFAAAMREGPDHAAASTAADTGRDARRRETRLYEEADDLREYLNRVYLALEQERAEKAQICADLERARHGGVETTRADRLRRFVDAISGAGESAASKEATSADTALYAVNSLPPEVVRSIAARMHKS